MLQPAASVKQDTDLGQQLPAATTQHSVVAGDVGQQPADLRTTEFGNSLPNFFFNKKKK